MTFDITKTKYTHTFPSGLRIKLDASEIYPNDPGQGTPAMAYYKKGSGTFDCAADMGEMDDAALPDLVCAELDSARDSVWAWVDYHFNRISAGK